MFDFPQKNSLHLHLLHVEKDWVEFFAACKLFSKSKKRPDRSEFPDYLSVSYGYAKKKKKEKKNEIITWFPLNIDVNGILNYRASYFVKRRMWKTGRQ